MVEPRLRRRRIAAAAGVCGWGLALLLAATGGLPGPLASGTAQATLSVSAEETGATISSGLFGANHRYAYDGFGSFDENGQPHPRLIEEIRSAGVSVLRYPGGTIANTFRWKRAVGPLEDRGCQTSGGDGAPLESTIGPDEHMELVERSGATTTMVVNFATATPQEAADWVAYMNAPVGSSRWADLRAAHGHPEPYGVTWWEVGNELDVGDQAYWMDQHPSMLPIPSDTLAHKYAYGGTTKFSDQPLTADCDRRAETATSDGTPAQVRQVPYPPVAPGAVLSVGGTTWAPVTTLAAAGPDDRVYTLDRTTGRVDFGDGVNAAIPAEGTPLRISYTSGPHPGYVDFVRAMKAVDPDIKVCAAFQGSTFVDAIGNDPAFDCHVAHPYWWLVVPMGARQTHDNAMMGSDWQVAQVRDEVEQLQRSTGREVPLLLSEYGLSPVPGFSTWQEPGGDYLRSLSPALYAASQVVGFAKLGLPVALKHSLVDLPADHSGGSTSTNLGSRNVAIFGPGPRFQPSPTAEMLTLLSPLAGGDVVGTRIEDNPLRVTTAGRYRALTAVAARSTDGSLAVTVVNRDPVRAVKTGIRLDAAYAEVGVETLQGSAFDATDGVARVRKQSPLGGTTFTWTFPAHSVTVLNFER